MDDVDAARLAAERLPGGVRFFNARAQRGAHRASR